MAPVWPKTSDSGFTPHHKKAGARCSSPCYVGSLVLETIECSFCPVLVRKATSFQSKANPSRLPYISQHGVLNLWEENLFLTPSLHLEQIKQVPGEEEQESGSSCDQAESIARETSLKKKAGPTWERTVISRSCLTKFSQPSAQDMPPKGMSQWIRHHSY